MTAKIPRRSKGWYPEPAHIPEILSKAANVIDERGWHQGSLAGPGDPETCSLCGLGAIYVAADDVVTGLTGVHAADQFADWLHINGYAPPSDSDNPIDVIGSWNDQLDMTAVKVTTALRDCAAELAKAGV